jgi:hypothetical protein
METLSRLLCLLLALAAGAPAHAAGRLTRDVLASADAFRTVPMHEVLGLPPTPALAIDVTLPRAWRGREFPADTRGTVMWSTAGDYGLMRNRKRLTGRFGALLAERSQVSWNQQDGTFEDQAGNDEQKVEENLQKERPSKLRVQRIDRGDLPLLLVEADLTAQLKLRAIYVALGRNARVLRYVPQRPWNEADDLVWARLRDSVAGRTAAEP